MKVSDLLALLYIVYKPDHRSKLDRKFHFTRAQIESILVWSLEYFEICRDFLSTFHFQYLSVLSRICLQ